MISLLWDTFTTFWLSANSTCKSRVRDFLFVSGVHSLKVNKEIISASILLNLIFWSRSLWLLMSFYLQEGSIPRLNFTAFMTCPITCIMPNTYLACDGFIPLSTRPHQNVVCYNNSWLGFLNILNYVPKEREKYTAKNEPSFVTVKCCDGS